MQYISVIHETPCHLSDKPADESEKAECDSTSLATLCTVCNTMQSTGSRSNSPNPEQDTLLRPLNSPGTEVTDEMPIAKKVGDDRGIMDNIGLGLVYVCRKPHLLHALTHKGRLWGNGTAYFHLGPTWELCCTHRRSS
jgi:hypothetical protein